MKLTLKILLPLLLLAGAYSVVKTLLHFKKPKEIRAPSIVVSEAKIILVKPSDHEPPVRSYGTVRPLFETNLVAQVSGIVKEVAMEFRVGRRVSKGMILAKIDDTDYRAALSREQSNLANAKRILAEEVVRANQAAEDWVASGRKLSDASEFVLRRPQVEAARASIVAQNMAIVKAAADIKRSQIRVPYDAIITARSASVGNLATPQMSLGKLVATKSAKIRLPLTSEQVSRITIPELGKVQQKRLLVTLTTPKISNTSWTAEIVSSEPTVDKRNQVTYLIAEVFGPYDVKSQTLAMGAFVNASIPANPIRNSYLLPEAALVNDAFVWVIDKDNKLARVDVSRVYSLDGKAYVRIKGGDFTQPLRLVVRPLTNFRQGMDVRPITNEK
jgi:RND family efflux transporter MFP subunit